MRKMKCFSVSLLLIVIVYVSFPLYSYSSNENYSMKSNMAKLLFNAASRVIIQRQMEDGTKPKHSLSHELKLIFNDLRHSLLVGLLKDKAHVRCAEDLLYVFQNLGNPDNWAARMMDSYGKPESGILQGKLKWLGDYDECVKVNVPIDEASRQGDFNGQYCSLTVTVNYNSMTLPVNLGICLPDSCHTSALKLEETIKMNRRTISSNVPEYAKTVLKDVKLVCQPVSKKFTTEATLVICLISFFVLLTIIGSSITILEYFVKQPIKSHGSDTDIEKDVPSSKVDYDRLPLQDDRDEFLPLKNGYKDNMAVLTGIEKFKSFFNVFCVFTNGSKLLDTNGSENHLRCLHGIRFLSLCWVFMCHTYTLSINAIKNVSDVLALFDNWSSQIVLNGIFSIDSFFLLSGFLVANVFFKHSSKTPEKIKWIYVYIHRYLRLTPVYMIILVFYATLYSYLGSGPNWVNYDTNPACGKSWWWNLLYINNFQQSTDQCIEWSWYLASDLQFFVISPLILLPLLRRPKVGLSILATFFFVTFMCNFMVTYYFDLTAGFEKMISFDDWQAFFAKSMDTLDYIYKRPYTRISPYLIGILLAYYLHKRKQCGCGKNGLVTLTFGWIISSAVSFLCVFGLHNHKLSLAESCFYNAFSQTGFAVSLAWVIYVCVTGQGGFVNSFLSCKFFIPLSRLTYCVYLVHPIILMAYYESQKSLIHFSDMTMIVLCLGFLLICYSAALVTSLIFESPLIRLEKIIRSNLRKNEHY